MNSPIRWIGGKGLLKKEIVSRIPNHFTYVEVFGGGGSVLFHKSPSKAEVYNDLDHRLVNFFRVLRDPEKFKALQFLVSLTPYSREEYYYCRETANEGTDVEKAHKFFVLSRQGFGGKLDSYGTAVSESNNGMISSCSRWLNSIAMLPQVADRILRVQIENQDFKTILARYDTPETFFYLDPPYIETTRCKNLKYDLEMSLQDHKDLVQILLKIEGKSLLSGYDDNLTYKPLEESGWKKVSFERNCSVAGSNRFACGKKIDNKLRGLNGKKENQKRIETIWFNYEIQKDLF